MRHHTTLLILSALLLLTACGEEPDMSTYDGQLQALRGEYREFSMTTPRFFLFGMGNRDKFVYRDYQLISLDNDSVVCRIEGAVADSIMPDLYQVAVKTREGLTVIREDEHGIWMTSPTGNVQLSQRLCPLRLPTFDGMKYGKVLRVLHHEILLNIRDGRIYPNILVYKAPFLRDAFMGTLVLEKTGNTGLISDWMLQNDSIYDMQNRMAEADNLGELLYMLSYIPTDSNLTLRQQLQAEIEKQTTERGGRKFISGYTDGALNADYQTQILKAALAKNQMKDDYSSPPEDARGDYEDLSWFTKGSSHSRSLSLRYKDLRFNFNDSPFPYLQWARCHFYDDHQAPFPQGRYPLSWEKRGGSAHFEGMTVISELSAQERICYPHVWTAAEMFLKLYGER